MADIRVLIVDDEPNLLESFKIGLELKGYDVTIASSGSEALENCGEARFDVVLLDIRMPEMDGLETLRRLKELDPDQVVIMLTAHGSLESAVEAGRLGAYDYLEKPSTPEAVDLRIQRAVERHTLSEENRMLKSELRERYRFEDIVGNSTAMQDVYDLMERIVPTETTVLITGDTGTGKELVARALHHSGPRADGRFYALHCAAIPEELLESELFGHEKGAFTGAVSQKIGIFEAANGGTLFLDEVGEMSLAAQVRLLRVLQEKEFIRVGATTPRKTDVRLIAATNRDLNERVAEGLFREDLYYRLNVIEIRLPSLRERRDDIPVLAGHFLEKYAAAEKGVAARISEDAMERLVRHDWPGNVRELENAIERAVALAPTDTIQVSDLPAALQEGTTSVGAGQTYAHLSLQEARETLEQSYIVEVLTKTGGNITHASKMAGIAWQNFHQKLKKYGIDAKSFRGA
jgi:DNA-binding NtrC family response regulator